MEIKGKTEKDCLVIEVKGRLDAGTTSDFEAAGAKLIEQGPKKVVFDMSAVDYISSAGLRSLLALSKKIRLGQGTVSLCALHSTVRDVIRISGFEQIIPVYESLQAAMS